jgi:ABC-2 type transport system permease protein
MSAAREVTVLTVPNLLKSLRSPMLMIASLVQPIAWLAVFSQTFQGLADAGGLDSPSYLAFLVPGMVVLATLFSAVQSATATVADIDTGMLDRFLISPIRRSSILAARVAADALLVLARGALVLAVGLLMGARVRTGWPGVFALLALVTAFGVLWGFATNLIALASRNAELTMVLGFMLTLPALFLSPAFVPLTLQPAWLRTAAKFNPASYVIEIGQALVNTGNDWDLSLRTLAVLAMAGLVLVPLGAVAFRRATH